MKNDYALMTFAMTLRLPFVHATFAYIHILIYFYTSERPTMAD